MHRPTTVCRTTAAIPWPASSAVPRWPTIAASAKRNSGSATSARNAGTASRRISRSWLRGTHRSSQQTDRWLHAAAQPHRGWSGHDRREPPPERPDRGRPRRRRRRLQRLTVTTTITQPATRPTRAALDAAVRLGAGSLLWLSLLL